MLDFLQGVEVLASIRFALARFHTLTKRKVLSLVKVSSLKLESAHLTANEVALLRCETALEFKDKGDYEGAQEVMRPLWKRVGERPEIQNLFPSVSAEVLLCAGILTGWIGSRNQVNRSQELAKDLISEGITYFELAGDVKRIAAARAEIAYCYWRDGELNEARIMLVEALQRLPTEGETRARSLLKLTTVELSASRYTDALKILTDNAALFERVPNRTTRGTYFNQVAIVLRNLAREENRDEYLKRAISELDKADREFKATRNSIFRAHVKNNLALILLNLSRFKEAHKHLNEARRLMARFKDKARIAQIDETRAQVFIAEGKLKDAESVVHRAAAVFEKSGQQCQLAEALITQGIALARLGKQERAQLILQRAIEIAHDVGASNKAGLAALTLIEEVDLLRPKTLQAAYNRAREWLSSSQSHEILLRLSEAAAKMASSVHGELTAEEATGILLTRPCDLQDRMLKYERSLIKQALAQANGSVTHAASLLGLTHQGLAYVIEARHKDLLKERSPVRRRSRKPV